MFGMLPVPMPMPGLPPPPPPLPAEPPLPLPQRGMACEMLDVDMIDHLFSVGVKLRISQNEICELIQLAVYKLRDSARLRAHLHPPSLTRIISVVHPDTLGPMNERMGLHYLAILMIEKTKANSEVAFCRVGADKRGSGSFEKFYRYMLRQEPFNASLPFIWPIVRADN